MYKAKWIVNQSNALYLKAPLIGVFYWVKFKGVYD